MVSGGNRCILPRLSLEFSTLMTKPTSKQDKAPQVPPKPGASKDSDKAAKLSEHIGRELRSMFDGVVAEPVPDRFLELLEALEKKQSKN
jgi:hypothetical protein